MNGKNGNTFSLATTRKAEAEKVIGWPLAFGPFACCLVIFAIVSLMAIQHKGLTYDEANHLNYGNQLAFGHSAARPINSVMPITALNALALKIHDSLTGARAVTVLFSMFFAIVIFIWAFELYGLPAAWLSGLLYLCCPNILAHSNLVTTDIYAAGTVLLCMYCFWRFFNRPNLLHTTLCGASLGLALLAKYSSVALGPIFLIIAAIRGGRALARQIVAGPASYTGLVKTGLRFALCAVVMAVVAITVINAGNLFQDVFVPLADVHLRSQTFTVLLERLPWLAKVPVPTSFAWFQGLDWVLHDSSAGEATPRLYLFGELRNPGQGDAFTGYYFLVSLFKVPLSAQLILALAAFRMIRQRRCHRWLDNELFLLIPIAFFFYFFNFSMRTQVGLRHYLVIFPLVFVLAGSLLANDGNRPIASRWLKFAVVLLITAQLASLGRYYPHFIPYVNELVTDRRKAYKLFADSNLAWGGDEYFLKAYQTVHPEALFEPPAPAPGTIIVELNNLVGLLDPEKFRWLRENFEPEGIIAGGSYLVYQVEARDLAVIRATASNPQDRSGKEVKLP
jgi:4-amino-4-deoxy-L-arabinose transferase-like glycosyltransferase